MDSPIVNLFIQRKIVEMFEKNKGTSIKYLGTDTLLVENNAFGNAIAETSKLFDINQFARDVYFFFKVEKNIMLRLLRELIL